MFFKKKKQAEKKSDSRTLPKADISDFVPPVDPAVERINNSDADVLKSLQSELVKSGVVDDNTDKVDHGTQKIDELLNIMKDANDNAKSEKDFNSEFYDADVDLYFDNDEELRSRSDFDNPVLDGVDDYGNQVYDDSRNKRFI